MPAGRKQSIRLVCQQLYIMGKANIGTLLGKGMMHEFGETQDHKCIVIETNASSSLHPASVYHPWFVMTCITSKESCM